MSGKQEQIQRAIAQVSERQQQPIPTIDFTQHALDDGTAVSTQERIVKDVGFVLSSISTSHVIPMLTEPEGTSSCSAATGGFAVLLKGGSYQAGHRFPEKSLLP